MPIRVTANDQEALKAWAAPRMRMRRENLAPDMEAVGILDIPTNETLAVILFNARYNNYLSMHVASNGRKQWVTRFAARAVFGYAFEFKGVDRINVSVPVWNVPTQILCLKFGFRIEGTMRCGSEDGSDAILFGMLRRECRWIEADKGEPNGQGRT